MAKSEITGLFEAHLTVADLARSVDFYRDVVGLELAHEVPERHAAFFWIGGRGKTMLGLWSVHSSPLQLKLHIAFRVPLDGLIASIRQLRDAGVTATDGSTGQSIDEPVVIGWMPAASVYFSDPDGHLLEYITMLDDDPHPDLNWLPLSEWRRRTTQV
jgi:catechol 2,3-dioxygenase-like lactoylglutathione lyase family enzyme